MLSTTGSADSSASDSINMEALVESVPVTPWTIWPRRDGLLVGLGIVLLTSLAVGAVAWQASESMAEQRRSHLLRSAELAVARIDVEVVSQAVSHRRLSVADYDRLASDLARLKEAASEVVFVTLVAPGPSDPVTYLVEDNVGAGQRDVDHDGWLQGGELFYPVTVQDSGASAEALRTGLPQTDLTEVTEPCAVYHGAAAPIMRDGRVIAALLVDVDASPYLHLQRQLLAWVLGFLLANMILGGLIGWLVYRTRRNERALAEQRHQVLRSLQRARDRALAGDMAKTSFLAMMSHELRTPLNGILGMAELLRLGDLDPDARDMCGTIETCGRNLLSLVNDLLDFSAIETGRVDFHSAPFDPVEPLQSLLDSVAPLCDQKGLTLVLVADPALPARVNGDVDRVRQLVAPLVSNAVKFTQAGRIVLAARPTPTGVLYEIRDTGPGLPTHLRDRLFKPFQQGEDYLRRQHGGTGLGLAITGRLAQRMHAGVTATVENGTTFQVEVPLPHVEGPRTWPAPGSRGTVRIRHRDPEAAAALATDLACLGYTAIHEGLPELLIVDHDLLVAEGVPAPRLITQAGQIVVLLGLSAMVRESHCLADFGLIPLRKPCTRHQLAQAIHRSSASMTGIIRTPRPG